MKAYTENIKKIPKDGSAQAKKTVFVSIASSEVAQKSIHLVTLEIMQKTESRHGRKVTSARVI